MRDLSTVIRRCFSYKNGDILYKERSDDKSSKGVFLMIPCHECSFEMPVLAIHVLDMASFHTENPVDAAVSNLRHLGFRSQYKTLHSAFHDALNTSCPEYSLVRLPMVKGLDKPYYTMRGAVFNADFHPVMIMSWQMERFHTDIPPHDSYSKEGWYLRFVKPVLRIAPEVVLNKDDAVKRYIVNNIVPTALSLRHIVAPAIYANADIRKTYSNVEVVIGDIPFGLKEAEVPSVSTTNEALLNVALSHIDEVMQ